MTARRDFLGGGAPFPFRPDPDGRLGYVEGTTNVAQSVELLLRTRLGERLMRPSVGCGAERYLFAPGSELELRLLEDSVRDALEQQERRVDVLAVRAELAPEDETRVEVAVQYRERRTNAVGNLVFPFYLIEGAGALASGSGT
jgi:uncharacterized protein